MPHGNSSDYRHCCNGVFLPGMPGGMAREELTLPQLLPKPLYRSMAIGKVRHEATRNAAKRCRCRWRWWRAR